ncbi:uroporphyrinogen decarboxylase family protein [Actinomycetota bacterium]
MVNSKTLEPYTGEPDVGRLLATFKRQPVDRVPNFEVLYEDQHVEKFLGKFAGNTLAYGGDPAKGADAEQGRPMYPEEYLDLCEMIGQDALVFDAGLWTPYRRKDEEGNLVPAYKRDVKTRADYEELVLDSDGAIVNLKKYLKEYKDAIAKRNSKIGVAGLYGCIFQTLYEFVIGMNDFMMMVYEDRDLLEEMLEESTEHFIKTTQALVDGGADFIWPADDVAFKTGLFIPPELMKEMWVPRMAKIFEPAVNAGIPIMFHSDGRIDDIVEDLIEMGLDCLNPMDPYGVDYADYKARYGDRLCLSGNVDIEFPLSKGTPEDVDADVKKHMEIMKPGYGYVATVSHSVVNYIPHENVIAYLNAIHKYGKY